MASRSKPCGDANALPSSAENTPVEGHEWPPEVTLSHAVEDLLAAARINPGALDLDALAVAADRLTDLVGSLQERKAA